MNLPTEYRWLESIKGVPNTIKYALAECGVQEVVGKGSSKTILSWRDRLNQAGVKVGGYSDDAIPWCGLFAAFICFLRLKNPAEVVKEPLWARNWMKYGVKSPLPSLGDVLVFERGSGGHVGFYVAEDATAYHVLGGNQSDKVCITRVAKVRLLACRRPPYITVPKAVKPYWVAPSGGLSTGEA